MDENEIATKICNSLLQDTKDIVEGHGSYFLPALLLSWWEPATINTASESWKQEEASDIRRPHHNH